MAQIAGRTPDPIAGRVRLLGGGFAGSRNAQRTSEIHQIGGRILYKPRSNRREGATNRRQSEIGVEIMIPIFKS